MRRISKKIKIKDSFIGGDAPISIQSMTNTDTRNIKETVDQILALEDKGCEIIRVAVPDEEAAEAIRGIKEKINIPLIADIHFDYRLAIKSIENGVDGLRINPGNIGSNERVKEVIKRASFYGIPIRIGVNSGSLEKELLQKYGAPTAEALVESALRHISILENNNFSDIVISVKSSNVPLNIESYRILAEKTDYPLHIGVTEAGTIFSGTIKSAIGIGSLLLDGIGDTIRVSLTGSPLEEVRVAKEILRDCGLRKDGIEIISCPTCGRTCIDLITLAEKVEKGLVGINKPIKVAIMGCVVNGPGEAREADIGIAGGKGEGIIFKRGQIIKKVKEEMLLDELLKEIQNM